MYNALCRWCLVCVLHCDVIDDHMTTICNALSLTVHYNVIDSALHHMTTICNALSLTTVCNALRHESSYMVPHYV